MYRRKTRAGRLARLDDVLLALEHPLLGRQDGAFAGAPVVDVGLGAHPWTTLEWAEALSVVDPVPEVVGVDIAPDIVTRAQRHVRPGVRFEVGGFDLPVDGARVVRAMNVLRNYAPAEVAGAHAALGRALLPDGIVLEGSCSPTGDVGCVHVLRRVGAELHREALWMWTDFTRGFAPLQLRDRLPRDLRRSVRSDHALGRLFDAWTASFHEARRDDVREADRLFSASVRHLASPVLSEVRPGVVCWRPDDGVPAGW